MSGGIELPYGLANELHAELEAALEGGLESAAAVRAYRLLGWRLLAVRGGTGLTGRISELAAEAETLEEFEASRDRELGPILEGLENPANRDP
ncbi:hypothetical protein [Rubrobacter indicoceani]|uniref:hypothetical protein n=1 Tax=Rubrobacter indicoceani TaxID=2051957 RepID=UPI000E5C2AD1|nr:hypothetical protein [Rubrobacter indicoceani]